MPYWLQGEGPHPLTHVHSFDAGSYSQRVFCAWVPSRSKPPAPNSQRSPLLSTAEPPPAHPSGLFPGAATPSVPYTLDEVLTVLLPPTQVHSLAFAGGRVPPPEPPALEPPPLHPMPRRKTKRKQRAPTCCGQRLVSFGRVISSLSR